MDLLTEKALELGSEIAKGIFTRWLSERTEPGGTESIVSTFKKYIPEALAQRRAKIQLERVSVSIAEQMQSVFKIEGAHLDDGSVIAVAQAVSGTLEKAYLTPRTIAEQNLDPTKLVALCRSVDPTATRDFSEPEQELYGTVLSYAAQFICDTASRLPSFTEKTLGEILAREDVVLSKFNEIATNFQRIHEMLSPEAGSALRDKFETDFRLATIRRLSELSLFGLDVSETSRHYNLTVAYVALTVQQRATDDASQQHMLGTSQKKNQLGPDELERTISIEEGLESVSGKTLIVGHAGSGKTTLLQWLAVQAAGRSLEGRLSKYNDCVPFFIRLRDFAASPLPVPENFASLTTPEIGGRMPSGWVHEKLSQSKAILLVDGVDELPRNQRGTLREWVLSLHAQYPGVAIFLTARPYASNDEWFEHNGFAKVELQPMDLPRIGEFIEHWHSAVEMQLNSEAQRKALAPLAHGLKSLLGSQPRLAELASTPLLCAMICALYRDRNQRLPSDRVGLYKACIEALVDRRDPERRIALSDYPDISFRHKLLLLQDFAYYLLRNGLAEASQEQLESRVTGKLPSLGISGAPASRDVCRLLMERSGVLREVVAGRVDFIHKTFQEFLAAQAVLDEGDVGHLVKRAADDEWREVIILAAGLAPPRITEEIISSLIRDGDGDKARRHQLHLLAVGCLGTAVATGEDLRREVGKRIKELVPPKNLREAKELAAAGDLAVPFLRPEKKLKAQHAAACVRALSLIGSDAAFEALKAYARDKRQAVQQELFRGWSSFDVEDYAGHFFRDDDFVIVKPGVPLGALRQLTRIRQLFVDGAEDFSVAPLVHLSRLELLSVYGGRALVRADLAELPNLVSLKELHLWKVDVTSFPPLSSLVSLKNVSASEIPNLTSVDELVTAASLERFSLGDLPSVKSIPSLQRLGGLRHVSLRNVGSGQIVGSGCLPQQLDRLDVEVRRGISSLGFLEDLKLLFHLGLFSGSEGVFPTQEFLVHIARLGPQLHDLHLSGIGRDVDVSMLAGCSRLESLTLGRFRSLFNLDSLNVTRAPLRLELHDLAEGVDLSVLSKIERPIDLAIRYSGGRPIAVAPLFECKGLRSLVVDYVKVLDNDSLEGLKRKIAVDDRTAW